jgi:hypothetical protein
MPDAITLWRWVGVLAPCGAALALEWKLTIDAAEDEAFVAGHAVAGGVHAANQCESHSNPAIPEMSSARAATAARTATHSGHRFMALILTRSQATEPGRRTAPP